MKTNRTMHFISPLSEKFAGFLNTFNLSSSRYLRQQLYIVNEWEVDESHDLDWIKHTIRSFARLYESQALNSIYKESWYNSRVWPLIGTMSVSVKSLQVVRGECTSVASAKRKNAERAIGTEEKVARPYAGYKCDMIIREKKEKHGYIYEHCLGETKAEDQRMSTLEESGLKLSKTMKDTLENLILYNLGDHANLATFGVQYTGLSMKFLAADRPSVYVTRINRVAQRYVSSNISLFSQTILPLLVLVWQIKQQVITIKNQVLSNQARLNSSASSD